MRKRTPKQDEVAIVVSETEVQLLLPKPPDVKAAVADHILATTALAVLLVQKDKELGKIIDRQIAKIVKMAKEGADIPAEIKHKIKPAAREKPKRSPPSR